MVWRKGQSGNKGGKPANASSLSQEAAENILFVSKKLPKHLQLLALAVEDSKWFHEKIYPHIFRSGAAGQIIDQSKHVTVTINQLPRNEQLLIKEVIKERVALLTRTITATSEPLQLGIPQSGRTIDLEPITEKSTATEATQEQSTNQDDDTQDTQATQEEEHKADA